VTKALEIAKAKIANLEDSVEKEREKVKSLQSEVSNHREEVLEIKREKKDLKYKVGHHENQINDLQKDQTKLREEKSKFEKLLKEKSEAFNVRSSELTNLHKEKVKVDKDLQESLAELDIFTLNFSEPIKKVETVFTCPFCEGEFKCKIELSQHVRIKHVRDQMSQTETQKIPKRDISSYPCFYCDKELKSYEILLKHRTDCPEIGIFEEEDDSTQYLENTY
jgi:predicted RNase H-like nuclease (RuvC/YqgF family)